MIVQYIYNILINEYKETSKLRDEAEHSSESQQLTQPFSWRIALPPLSFLQISTIEIIPYTQSKTHTI